MRRKFHLNKQDGKVMGVCAGLADYTGIEALWIRLAAALLVIAGLGSLLIVYVIVGLVADKRPDRLDDGFGRGSLADDRYRRDSGLADVQHYYSASNPRLSREIDELR
ncbi:MAG TPA: PspC domain-containing protein [Novosphingobium sp.]